MKKLRLGALLLALFLFAGCATSYGEEKEILPGSSEFALSFLSLVEKDFSIGLGRSLSDLLSDDSVRLASVDLETAREKVVSIVFKGQQYWIGSTDGMIDQIAWSPAGYPIQDAVDKAYFYGIYASLCDVLTFAYGEPQEGFMDALIWDTPEKRILMQYSEYEADEGAVAFMNCMLFPLP